MKFDVVYKKVGRSTLMSREKAIELYDFILENRPKEIFKMGFYHGGSANIMAAAQEEIGGGRVVTYDFFNVKDKQPNILDLLDLTHLHQYVKLVFCDWCCEWELAKKN